MTADWKRSGVKPPALERRPELDASLMPYLDAYNTLRCHRTRSEAGLNPINYQDLVKYAEIRGLTEDTDTFLRFETLVQACDHSFLDFADEKRNAAIASAQKKAAGKNSG